MHAQKMVAFAQVWTLTLAEPINFGNPQNDPVKVVVALAATDNKSHIEGLSDLAEVMSEESIVDKLPIRKLLTKFWILCTSDKVKNRYY